MYARFSEISAMTVKGETMDNPEGITIPDVLQMRGAGKDYGCAGQFPYDGSGGLTPPDGDRLTLQDFIYSTYNSLLDAGWRMREIDEMDMLGFL